ncbi:alpha/beta-hydrolase [Ganoderma leucocontextum]|nr:alpha/beta-hydrolase [Ganoderma leucocontextum]
MSDIEATDFTLPALVADGRLDVVATRYRLSDIQIGSGARLSLVCLHAVSYYKETWLPTIECLFQLQAKARNNRFTVIEAWSIDSPNHGRAAIANEDRLMSIPQGLDAHDWARAIQVLLQSGLIQGTSIVGLGHSGGGCVLPLTTIGYPIDQLPFSSIVLVEPGIMTPQMIERVTAMGTPYNSILGMAKTRRDTWPSREAARAWMSTRLPWKHWTPRSLDLFVEYGLRDLPTMTYPDAQSGVTLCCTRVQEVAGYIHNQDSVDTLERLKDICPVIPVHCVFGDRTDLIPDIAKADIVDERQGRKMATMTTIPGRGHLILMEDPQSVALAVWGILHHCQWGEKLSRL